MNLKKIVRNMLAEGLFKPVPGAIKLVHKYIDEILYFLLLEYLFNQCKRKYDENLYDRFPTIFERFRQKVKPSKGLKLGQEAFNTSFPIDKTMLNGWENYIGNSLDSVEARYKGVKELIVLIKLIAIRRREVGQFGILAPDGHPGSPIIFLYVNVTDFIKAASKTLNLLDKEDENLSSSDIDRAFTFFDDEFVSNIKSTAEHEVKHFSQWLFTDLKKLAPGIPGKKGLKTLDEPEGKNREDMTEKEFADHIIQSYITSDVEYEPVMGDIIKDALRYLKKYLDTLQKSDKFGQLDREFVYPICKKIFSTFAKISIDSSADGDADFGSEEKNKKFLKELWKAIEGYANEFIQSLPRSK